MYDVFRGYDKMLDIARAALAAAGNQPGAIARAIAPTQHRSQTMTTEPAIITHLRQYLSLCANAEQITAIRPAADFDTDVQITIGPLKLTSDHVRDILAEIDRTSLSEELLHEDAQACAEAYINLADLGLAAQPEDWQRILPFVTEYLQDQLDRHMSLPGRGSCSCQGGCDCAPTED